MIHRQISVKLHEELYARLVKTSSTMRMNTHAFVVNSLEETLNMIENRGCEKVPLLVVQARTAQDYVQAAPPLPIRSEATSPPPEIQEVVPPVKTKSMPLSRHVPKKH